jgi:hypothetical protein
MATKAKLEKAPSENEFMLHQIARLIDDANQVALDRGDKYGLCDAIDNSGQPYQSAWAEMLIHFCAGLVATTDKVPGADAD